MAEYLIITPARDEEQLLPALIESVAAQTMLPRNWIIIDDGSVDATGQILDRAAARYPWIRPVHLPRRPERRAGGESVIMQFLRSSDWRQMDYLLRLDADLTFAPDFAELLLREFAADARLGIAGATLYEPHGGEWQEMVTPAFHTRGATKMYSRECFAAIGELESGVGWDTIDEMRATMSGFRTRSFRHIRANHHRPQGSAEGGVRGFFGKGQTAYYIGYSPIFLAARAAKMALSRPIGAALMFAGYVEGYVRRRPMIDDAKLIRFIRRQQHRRLLMLDTVWR